MAYAGITIEFYEDAADLTAAHGVINGRLISSTEDATVSTIETATIPKACTYITVYSSVDCFIEISTGTPAASAGRRMFLKSGQYRSFEIGPSTAGQYSISYVAA